MSERDIWSDLMFLHLYRGRNFGGGRPWGHRVDGTSARRSIVLCRGSRETQCQELGCGASLVDCGAKRVAQFASGAARVVVDRGPEWTCPTGPASSFGAAHLIEQPQARGNGIALLYALIDLIIESPHGQLVVWPAEAHHNVPVLFDALFERALSMVADCPERTMVVPVSADGRRGESGCAPVLVGTPQAMLNLFVEYDANLVRMFVYQASMPSRPAARFLDRAYEALRDVDLVQQVLRQARNVWIAGRPKSLLSASVSSTWRASRLASSSI